MVTKYHFKTKSMIYHRTLHQSRLSCFLFHLVRHLIPHRFLDTTISLALSLHFYDVCLADMQKVMTTFGNEQFCNGKLRLDTKIRKQSHFTNVSPVVSYFYLLVQFTTCTFRPAQSFQLKNNQCLQIVFASFTHLK